jgi:outer membrane protein TolC
MLVFRMCALLFAGLIAAAAVGAEPPSRAVTLADALRATLGQHPQIQAQDAAARIAEGNRQTASGAFDYMLTSGLSAGRTDKPEYVPDAEGAASLARFETENDSFQLGLSKQTRFGVTLNPAISVSRAFTADAGQVDQYGSTLGFTLTVPLLRGRGSAASALERDLAAQAEAIRSEVLLTASQQALATIAAYWQCVSAGIQLDIQRNIESNALELVDLTRALIAGYVQSSNELAYTQAYLSQNVAARLQAEAFYAQRLAALHVAMGLEANPAAADPWLLPADPLPRLPAALDVPPDLAPQLVALAMERRPDLAAVRKQLEAATIRREAARNAALPQVDVQLFGGYAGAELGGDFANGAQAMAAHLEGPAVAAAVSLAWPLRNDAARGSLLVAQGQLDQVRAGMQLLANQVQADVRSGVSNVRLYLQTCASQDESANFYQQTRDDRQTLYKSGQDTLVNLISANNDLGAAQIRLVSSQVAALVAIAQLLHDTGTLVVPDGGERFEINLDALARIPLDR